MRQSEDPLNVTGADEAAGGKGAVGTKSVAAAGSEDAHGSIHSGSGGGGSGGGAADNVRGSGGSGGRGGGGGGGGSGCGARAALIGEQTAEEKHTARKEKAKAAITRATKLQAKATEVKGMIVSNHQLAKNIKTQLTQHIRDLSASHTMLMKLVFLKKQDPPTLKTELNKYVVLEKEVVMTLKSAKVWRKKEETPEE